MKKFNLFIWMLSILLLLFTSSPAMAVKLSVKFDSSDLGDFTLIGMGIANQTTCDNFGQSDFQTSSIDTKGTPGTNVSLGVALVTTDYWSASLASTLQISNNCAIPGLSNSIFIAGSEINLCITYPTVTKDTTFSLNLRANPSSVKDQGDFTLTVGCTQP